MLLNTYLQCCRGVGAANVGTNSKQQPVKCSCCCIYSNALNENTFTMEPNFMNPGKTLEQSGLGTAAYDNGFVLLRREVSLKVLCESNFQSVIFALKYTID